MKKLLLLLLLLLNFSLVPLHADDQLADLTTSESTADVLIDLPPDLPPGYHAAVVEVTDPETQEVTNEEVNFCKDKTGEIHWDNICPDLDIVVDPKTLETVTEVESLPIYNPETEPEKTAQTQVGGFAALSVLSAGGAAAGATGAPGATVYFLQAPFKISFMGPAYIYMEVEGMNCIDETSPWNFSEYTLRNNQTNGIVN